MKKPLVIILTALMLLLSGCGSEPVTADIVATTLPVYDFTVRITAGTDLTVSVLVTESVSCLHDYSLQVHQMRLIEGANTVILSGAGLEDFLSDLLENSVQVDASAGISLLCASHSHDHEDHDHHAHEDTQEFDAHIWLSPANASCMAKNIALGLIDHYPQHEQQIQSNLTALLQNLDVLQQYGQQTLSELRSRDLITFHDGFSYFADSFDLHILEAVEEESGSEASAKELIHLITLVQDHKLPAIFTETHGSVSAANVISRETGANIYALDMCMGDTGYFEAMYRNIDTIKEALG
jgi:ABC-type Zn uptake system ZnuABC Zn-binding protein ZnuA